MKALGPERIDQLARSADQHMGLEDYLDSLANRPAPPRWRPELMSFLLTFVLSLALILLVRLFVLQNNSVVGTSMAPTLEAGDQILVEKVSVYLGLKIKRGDIVTVDASAYEGFSQEERHIIKRVVGLPGEKVSIREGRVYLDDQLLDEAYLDPDLDTVPRHPHYAELVLGANEYYLLGDNRPHSIDSRALGPISRGHMAGRLVFRFYPFSKIGIPR